MPKPRFLLDADMPKSSGNLIKSLGYDVEDVRDIRMSAAKDKEIIEYALRNHRVIVTRDTDFGEILRYPSHPGAIILRLPNTFTAEEVNERLRSFLTSIDERRLRDVIVIVERSRYRIRELSR
jgi:predicted nuclease of predicted toxin-antitoxin system